MPVYKIVIDKNSDTTNALFDSLKINSQIKIVYFSNDEELRSNLIKGRIAGIIKISKTNAVTPAYKYSISSTNASDDKWPQLLPILNAIVTKISDTRYSNCNPIYMI